MTFQLQNPFWCIFVENSPNFLQFFQKFTFLHSCQRFNFENFQAKIAQNCSHVSPPLIPSVWWKIDTEKKSSIFRCVHPKVRFSGFLCENHLQCQHQHNSSGCATAFRFALRACKSSLLSSFWPSSSDIGWLAHNVSIVRIVRM